MALLAVVAFAFSLLAVRVFLSISQRRLLDQPGGRSSHARPTPTGGGFPAVWVFLAVAAAGVSWGLLSGGPRWWASLLCAGVLSLLGLTDDALDLPSSVRLGIQILVGVTSVALLDALGSWPGPRVLALGAAIIFVVGMVNAFNFMDGIDALVGGTGIVILAFLALYSGDWFWIVLAASYAGFVVFNLPPARLFMGDAGSTVLGGLVAIAFLSNRESLEVRHLMILAPLIGDSAYTVARRLLRRENIARAHHSHLYQRLLRAGYSHGPITASYVSATIVIGASVWLWGNVGASIMLIGCVLAVVTIERHLRQLNVPFTRPQSSRSSELVS
jgi:UDP-N-acetylmuramyl pentapeptide phosphotransferase/UDP-N-acetylglucosamine-1-phosphate transferase